MRKLLIWYADNSLWIGKAGFAPPLRLPAMRLELLRLLKERGVKQFLISKNFNEVLRMSLDYFDITPYFKAVYGEPLAKESELALQILYALDSEGLLIADEKARGPKYGGFYQQAGVVLPSETERIRLREMCPGLIVCAPEEIEGIVSKEYTPEILQQKFGPHPYGR